ncbi:alpha-(1-_3)-arabinofuranosyltransferase domain-containing protein [Branchiibius hedensis]|uniref:alpha-(1->3)-arabinofuranosyltransferase domain-containing protein n=1 Tax=Branchiibius hedensis TaxID=672460 RepID=UPI0014747C29|nr:alpha-(1->3)-arabinofuranosyltransferase family protein [Branchiibius hedensis]
MLNPYRFAVGVGTIVLAAIVFLNGLGTFNTDIKPEIYLDPWRTAGSYLSAWISSPFLGSPNFNVGVVPVLAVTGVLRTIGLSPEWTFKVFHLGLWLIAAWGANRLLRELSPRISRWAALAAGVLYLANPYTVQAGSTLAIALPLAFLPWQLLCFLRALRAETRWGRLAWAGLFGLCFFAMSGMNAGVVPVLQLLALLPLIVFARWQWQIGWGRIALTVLRCALFVIGVSAYWLVPAMSASATGASITAASETIDGIAKVSSYPEVLRGMGLWPLYGFDADGAWIPQYTAYVTSPLIMLLTIVWPALALVSLRWSRGMARWFATGAIAVAAVVMVGAYPGTQPASPFGALLSRALAVPALSAFRTTNKVGAVLALAFAMALGAGAWALAHRLRSLPAIAPMVGAGALALVTAWTLPAVTGNLYISPLDIPDYWNQAAAAADAGNPDSAVLMLPGQVSARYRWSTNRPDDLANALFTRNVIIPYTTPNASAPAANYLAALDDTLQSGTAPTDFVSTAARYLGVDKVLLRHDIDWQTDGGASPLQTAATLDDDQGLTGERNFGEPGEYLFAGASDVDEQTAKLTPLQLFSVKDSRTTLRAESAQGSLLVAGDGWAIPQLSAAGELRTTPSFEYAAGLSTQQFQHRLATTGRLVLTDTNARRDTLTSRLTNGQGALLAADEPLDVTRTLGTNTDDQTVLVRSGARVTASSYGGAFVGMPYAVPENAVDGNPQTAWLFGDFGRADGQWLQIALPQQEDLHTIKIAQVSGDAGLRIDKVTVQAGSVRRTVSLPDSGYGTVDLGGVRASTVRITIDSTRGSGFNVVGIRDVELGGAVAVRAARTPLTFSTTYAALDSAGRREFDATPLDVLLTRVRGTAAGNDDPETGLQRIVTLPDARTFSATATIRVTNAQERQRLDDDLAGYATDVRVTASGSAFDQAGLRPSQAADGSSATAWVPASTSSGVTSLVGAWWQIDTARRPIRTVTIDQQRGAGDDTGVSTRWADRVAVLVDGKQVATATLKHDGTTTIPIPGNVQGSSVRVRILTDSGAPAGPAARFAAIDTGATVHAGSGATAPDPCRSVTTVDGTSLTMRPATDAVSASGSTWRLCDPTVALTAGQHTIAPVQNYVLDSLRLRDQQTVRTAAGITPSQQIIRNDATHKTIAVHGQGTVNVLIGQSYDSRWTATANGKSLGAPQVIDGYSTGWRVTTSGDTIVDIHYAPQTSANLALAGSAGFLLAALLLASRRSRLFALAAVPDGTWRAPSLTSRRRWLLAGALVVVSGFFVGVPGLVAAVGTIAAVRIWRLPGRVLQWAGAAAIGCSMVVYLVVLGDARGTQNATAVGSHLWPHYLAGAGLVVALAGTLRTLWRDGDEDD